MMPFSDTMETSGFLKYLKSIIHWESLNNSTGVPGKRIQLVLLEHENKDLKTNTSNKQNPLVWSCTQLKWNSCLVIIYHKMYQLSPGWVLKIGLQDAYVLCWSSPQEWTALQALFACWNKEKASKASCRSQAYTLTAHSSCWHFVESLRHGYKCILEFPFKCFIRVLVY